MTAAINSRVLSLPLIMKLSNSDFKNNIESGKLFKPKAYVEIVDTDGSTTTTLATCISFSIQESRDNIAGTFSCMIAKASIWNPRTVDYADLLSLDTRKRINIYYGRNFDGTIVYVQIFTGVLTKNPESYSFGGQEVISLSGSNIGYLLSKNYSTSQVNQTYTGTGKTLLQQWLDYANIEYSLTYTDTISLTSKSIAYDTALQGLTEFKKAYGPAKELFIDGTGFLTYRDIPDWSADDVEYSYDQSNIISLNKELKLDDIPTIVTVTGDSNTATYTYTASSEILTQYGRNNKSLSSGLVTTLTQATNLATDIFNDGQANIDNVSISMLLNPYLTLGSNITVVDSALSSITETQLRINSMSHTYTFGSVHETSINGVLQ